MGLPAISGTIDGLAEAPVGGEGGLVALVVVVVVFVVILVAALAVSKTRCPTCGKPLKTPFGMWGTARVTCRSCGTSSVVATGLLRRKVVDSSPVPVTPVLPSTGTLRACPWCAEQIQSAAQVCRFCGRDVAPVV
jgi:tRNA(Ile2) C34 agmatinyltransferase TiaS